MHVLQRADLAMRGAVVAPAGKRVALQRRLGAHILLEGVEAVQRIIRAKLLQHVSGVLVDLHRAGSEGDVVGAAVGERNESRKGCRDGVGGGIRSECVLLRLTEDRAVLQDALVLAKALIAEEEEGVVLPDGTSDGAAEVVALQRSLVSGVRQRAAGRWWGCSCG